MDLSSCSGSTGRLQREQTFVRQAALLDTSVVEALGKAEIRRLVAALGPGEVSAELEALWTETNPRMLPKLRQLDEATQRGLLEAGYKENERRKLAEQQARWAVEASRLPGYTDQQVTALWPGLAETELPPIRPEEYEGWSVDQLREAALQICVARSKKLSHAGQLYRRFRMPGMPEYYRDTIQRHSGRLGQPRLLALRQFVDSLTNPLVDSPSRPSELTRWLEKHQSSMQWSQKDANEFVALGGVTCLFEELRATERYGFPSRERPSAECLWMRCSLVTVLSHLARKSARVMRLLVEQTGPGGLFDLALVASAYCPPQLCGESELQLVWNANSTIFELLFAMWHQPETHDPINHMFERTRGIHDGKVASNDPAYGWLVRVLINPSSGVISCARALMLVHRLPRQHSDPVEQAALWDRLAGMGLLDGISFLTNELDQTIKEQLVQWPQAHKQAIWSGDMLDRQGPVPDDAQLCWAVEEHIQMIVRAVLSSYAEAHVEAVLSRDGYNRATVLNLLAQLRSLVVEHANPSGSDEPVKAFELDLESIKLVGKAYQMLYKEFEQQLRDKDEIIQQQAAHVESLKAALRRMQNTCDALTRRSPWGWEQKLKSQAAKFDQERREFERQLEHQRAKYEQQIEELSKEPAGGPGLGPIPEYFKDVLEKPSSVASPQILATILEETCVLNPIHGDDDPVKQTVVLYKVVSEGSQLQRLAAYSNREDPKVAKELEIPGAVGQTFDCAGLVGLVAQQRRPVLTNDLHGHESFDPVIDSFGEDSENPFTDAVVVPIGERAGVLLVLRDSVCHLKKEEKKKKKKGKKKGKKAEGVPERMPFSCHDFIAFQEVAEMARGVVDCPTERFWSGTTFPHCPKCGWGAKGIQTPQDEPNTVMGNIIADHNPETVEALPLAIKCLIKPKAREQKKIEDAAARAQREAALEQKILQDRAGVDLKLAWATPDISMLQLSRVDRYRVHVVFH